MTARFETLDKHYTSLHEGEFSGFVLAIQSGKRQLIVALIVSALDDFSSKNASGAEGVARVSRVAAPAEQALFA